MGYNFRIVQVDKNNRKRIQARCDKCHIVKFVRRDWASRKLRENGVQSEYYCSVCSGKRNIIVARERKMDLELLNEFVTLCEEIFVNLYDDKSEAFIGKKLGSTSFGLIRDARDFVYDYINTGVDDKIYECAEYIENGADDEIIELYDWATEMKAHALLHLETLPRPEGL